MFLALNGAKMTNLAKMAQAKLHERLEAKHLYWRGYTCAEISRMLGVQLATVSNWRRKEKWDETPVIRRVESQVEVRLMQLIHKDNKNPADYNEMESISKLIERTARIERYQNSGNECDLNPQVAEGHRKRRQKYKDKKSQPLFTEEDIDQLKSAFLARLYPHQREWWEQASTYSMRQYLKARQIGATYYFALEALIAALETGKNQIFLSASKNQAFVFKNNIRAFVKTVLDKDLRGENIALTPETTLYFLGTNSNTAQSYSGDLYIDEYFWIMGFSRLQHLASGMATHDDRRITYFSTPSSTAHEAYPFWTGEHFNRGRPKKDHIQLDVSHRALKGGRLCEDGYFRQMITVVDAIDKGFDRVSIDKLKLKFPPAQFDNLLMCKFINDVDSLFKLDELQRCMVDSWTIWTDFHPLAARPLANAPVWIGYDPARSQDDASLVVVAPPSGGSPIFRVIEKCSFNGLDFEAQAGKIQDFCQRYNVEHIAIDATGIGQAVFELVLKFYPRAQKIIYTVESKNEMVLKAKQLIQHGRLQWDHAHSDIAAAFLTIHQAPTASGRAVSYRAHRTASTGHADLAWALMHALINDPLDSIEQAGSGRKRGRIQILD